jgi:hypothetical protein
MARKAFVATEAMREKVKYLADVGVPQDDIAKIIGCAPKTLRRRFRDELDRGVAEANATVSGYLYNAAKAGSIAAIIFWLKTRAHWQERMVPQREDDSETGGAPTRPMLVILPDNHRDPDLRDPELVEVLVKAQDKYYEKKRRQEERKRALCAS